MNDRARDRESDRAAAAEVAARHLRIGWWALLAYLSLGIVLEGLHGVKAGLYLDVDNETRRHMWTLAHAHGTVLSLVCLAFAFSARALPGWPAATRDAASRCLTGALVLMPLGFGLGGAFLHDGDPGLGILLVPMGGLLLLVAVWLTARATAGADAG